RERRDAMVSALERHLPEATWTVPEGGYFVWVELPSAIAASDLRAEGARCGVRVGRPPPGLSRPRGDRAEPSCLGRLNSPVAVNVRIGGGAGRAAGQARRRG